MRRLLCYAAPPEAGALLERKEDFLCIGVGMASAAARVGRALARDEFTQVILFGVGGAWPERLLPVGESALEIGALAVVGRESFGDLGVSMPDRFSSLAALGLAREILWPMDPRASTEMADFLGCSIQKGVTVARGSGVDAEARGVLERSGARIESMEGAAVALACAEAGVPMLQLRAVSNYVGDRERGQWSLDRACRSLQNALASYLDRA